MRIISLVPSHTEILFALGFGDQLVGVTAHCDYPPEVDKIQRVGLFGNPSIEKILSLQPDLVLLDSRLQGNCQKELQKAGIEVFDFFPFTLEELFSGMERLIDVVGGGGHARQVVVGLRIEADRLIKRAKRLPSRRLLFVMGSEVLATPGPASMQYGALSSLGLELYPVDSQISYLPLSWGDVANFNPEILLVCGRVPGREEQKRCPGCSVKNPPCARDVEEIYQVSDIADVRAVKERKVFTVPCSFFCRPGPRILKGMEWLVGTVLEDDRCTKL